MIPKIIIMYSEIFDSRPTMDELIDLIKPLPLRHAALILSYINLVVRYGMQDIGEQNFSAAQASLFNGHFNDEAFELIKTRLGVTRCDERPIFVPQSVLALLRLVLVHSDPVPLPDAAKDEAVRYAIGRACLMMNNLLFTEQEERALQAGDVDSRRVELMVQALSSIELANPQKAHDLMPRLQIMYRLLLKIGE